VTLKIHVPDGDDAPQRYFVASEYGYVEKDAAMSDGSLPKRGLSPHPRPQHWHDRRKESLDRDNRRCRVCNSDFPLEVHHRTYTRWGWEIADDLTTLCGPCHEAFHKTRRLAA